MNYSKNEILPFSFPKDQSQKWLTPPCLYNFLNDEFHFDFDPCPFPRPVGFNALEVPWGKMNFVNPPFLKVDAPFGGPTAFARKAIAEYSKGNRSVLLLPVRGYVNELLLAGAVIRPLGRVYWIDPRVQRAVNQGTNTAVFILP